MRTCNRLAAMAVLCCTAAIAGCGGSDEGQDAAGAGDSARLVLVADESGPAGVIGKDIVRGAEIAVDQVNKSKRLGDTQLELDVRDAGTKQPLAVKYVNEAVRSDALAVAYTPIAPTTGATAPIAQQGGLPYLSISGDQPDVLDIGDYIFHTSPPPDSYQHALAEFWKTKGVGTMARVFASDNGSIAAISDAWAKAAADNDIEITNTTPIKSTDTDFSTIVAEIARQNPDAVIALGLVGQTNTLITQLRRAGYRGRIGGLNGSLAYFLPTLKRQADGVTYPTSWSPAEKDALSVEFTDEYTNRYNEAPREYAALGYDGVMFLAEGLEALKGQEVTREGLKDALHDVQRRGYKGLLGPIRFGPGSGGDRDAHLEEPKVATWLDSREQSGQ